MSLPEPVLLVSAEAQEGGPAALLPFRGATLLDGMLDEFVHIGVGRPLVLVRQEWRTAVSEAVGHRARVEPYADAAALFGLVADTAGSGSGPLVVMPADVVAQSGAVQGMAIRARTGTVVLAQRARRRKLRLANGTARPVDPEQAGTADTDAHTETVTDANTDAGTAVLAETDADVLAVPNAGTDSVTGAVPDAERPGPSEPLLRAVHNRVVSAGSTYHRVSVPTHRLLPALTVGSDDRQLLSRAARQLVTASSGWPAAEQDAVALLTVAMVRNGAVVTAAALDGGHQWTRAASPEQVAAADAVLRSVDDERLRLDSVVKGKDGFFTTFLVSPYSKYIARWAARRGLTPNQVTVASLVVGLLSAASLAVGSRPWFVLGALLLQVSFTLDCVDGQLARYTRHFSALGAWLDATFDRTKEYVVYVGLALGATQSGDNVWTLAAAALALQMFRHTVDFGYGVSTTKRPDPLQLPLAQVDDVPAEKRRVPTAPQTPPAGAVAPTATASTTATAAVTESPATAATAATAAAAATAADPPDQPPAAVPKKRRRRRKLLKAAALLDHVPGARWLKRVIVLPIGERWALISVTIALFSPRVTFIALIVAGAIASAYSTVGRLLRTMSR